ncbi:hypothetical protein [Bacteroides reticulotermitis]|nr:hypothetical protein [Bacteroides reticulotermitis]
MKRIINGKPYLRDEDRMIASSWMKRKVNSLLALQQDAMIRLVR